mgnify:CR=1 FL=1
MKINNKDATAYSNKELSHIIKKVLGEKNKANLGNLLGQILDTFGEWIPEGFCIDCHSFNCSDCVYEKSIEMIETNKYGLIQKFVRYNIIIINKKNLDDFSEDDIRNIIIEIIGNEENADRLIWILERLVEKTANGGMLYLR